MAKKAEKSGELKLSRADLVSMFEELGAKSAATWSASRLLAKLKKLPSDIDEDTECDTEESQALLEKAVAAVKDGRTIKIIDEEEADEVPRKGKAGKAAGKNGKPAKGKKASKEDDEEDEAPAKKGGKMKGAKAPKAKKEKEGGPSNKEQVYRLWEKSKDKSPAKSEEYHKKVGESVKLATIKSWISAWNRGDNLPACAKE